MRKGSYKLIRFHEDNHVELYDLREDPGEKKNLAKAYPAKTKELTRTLDQWLQSLNAKMPQPNPKFDPAKETEGYWWKEPGAFDRYGPAKKQRP